MALSLVTAPTVVPLDRGQVKVALKVDTDVDDILIDTLTQAALEYVQTFTKRKAMTQTWDLKLDGFPSSYRAIELPFPPVSSVTSVSYVDTNGDTQTWSAGSAGYTTDLPQGPQAMPARIYPSYGVTYPQARMQPNAVTVRFVCGYGSTTAAVPASLLEAQQLLIGHWYYNREGSTTADLMVLPIGIDALLQAYVV